MTGLGIRPKSRLTFRQTFCAALRFRFAKMDRAALSPVCANAAGASFSALLPRSAAQSRASLV